MTYKPKDFQSGKNLSDDELLLWMETTKEQMSLLVDDKKLKRLDNLPDSEEKQQAMKVLPEAVVYLKQQYEILLKELLKRKKDGE